MSAKNSIFVWLIFFVLQLLLLDYDGTLTPIVKDHMAAVPPASTINALRRLASDERNKIYHFS